MSAPNDVWFIRIGIFALIIVLLIGPLIVCTYCGKEKSDKVNRRVMVMPIKMR